MQPKPSFLIVAGLIAAPLGAQQLTARDGGGAPSTTSRPAVTTVATAIRASAAPQIDGLDADALWREAIAVD